MSSPFSRPLLAVFCLFLAACRLPTPPAPSTSPPVMQVWDGAHMGQISSEEPGAGALLDAFMKLVQSVRQQARTFYPPPRFEEEVTRAPYFLARFPTVTTLPGDGMTLQARQVAVTRQQGELLLLVQTEDDGDWSVYLPGDPDAERQFLEQMLDVSRVQIGPE